MTNKHAINHEAWTGTLIGFIRERGLERELKDWCGGWPCPIPSDEPAIEAYKLFCKERQLREKAEAEVERLRSENDHFRAATLAAMQRAP